MKNIDNSEVIFIESTVHFVPGMIINRIWRWQYATRKNIARPFKMMIYNLRKRMNQPKLIVK